LGADREADPIPATASRLVLSCAGQLGRNPSPTTLGQHEDVLNLWNPNVRLLPRDVSVTDRPTILPGDQIRRTILRMLIEAIERQMLVNHLSLPVRAG
jgi:hypothetical protein